MTDHDDPVAKAIWFIESHLRDELTLEGIEPVGGVTRFTSRGRSQLRPGGRSCDMYARGVSAKLRAFSLTARPIFSPLRWKPATPHTRHSRAFREQFGVTPEMLRAQGHLENIALVAPVRKETLVKLDLEKPRIETGKRLLVAGVSERDCDKIPFTWQRFAPYIGSVPGQVGSVTYGVKANPDDAGNFEYIAGVEVASFEDVPPELTRLRLPERNYAVFEHRGHVSSIRNTFAAIYSTWLPQAGLELADAPDFERYDERFDPHSGTGTVELWIPVTGARNA